MFLVVVNDVGVKIVEAHLPWFVLTKQRIAAVLPDDPQREFRILRIFHDASIEEEESPPLQPTSSRSNFVHCLFLPRYGVVKPRRNDHMTLWVETPLRFSGHPCPAVSSR